VFLLLVSTAPLAMDAPALVGTYGGRPPGCAASGGGGAAAADVAMKLCSEDMLPGVSGGFVVGSAVRWVSARRPLREEA
jgi:hypothetical protein